jgi:hypothetical protein
MSRASCGGFLAGIQREFLDIVNFMNFAGRQAVLRPLEFAERNATSDPE